MCTYVYVHVLILYIYISVHTFFMYIYIYMYIHTCTHICVATGTEIKTECAICCSLRAATHHTSGFERWYVYICIHIYIYIRPAGRRASA